MGNEKKKVQVWVYRRIQGGLEVLLLLTRPDRGSFWQPITGSVEEGEELLVAAARELHEETGMGAGAIPFSLRKDFSFEKNGKMVREYGYVVQAPASAGIRLDSKEHVKLQWVSPEEARDMLRYISNVEMLDALLTFLKQGTKA